MSSRIYPWSAWVMDYTNYQFEILEDIAVGEPLEEILKKLVKLIEAKLPRSRCSILLLDEASQRLYTGAAPNLPEAYNNAVNGIKIGPNVGSCGTAAHLAEAVIVGDISTDPRWAAYTSIAEEHGLKACWSTPILSQRTTTRKGVRVLGTFAVYPDEASLPDETFLPWLERAQHLACLALEHDSVNRELHQSKTTYRSVVDQASDVMVLYDSEGKLVDLNQKAWSSLQYEPKELIGCSPEEFDTKAAEVGLAKLMPASLGQEFSYESSYRRKDGTKFPVEVRIRSFQSGGHILHVATSRDITERRRTEAILERQRDLLLKTQALVGLGYFDWEMATGELTWSDTLYEIYGVDPESFQPTLESFMSRVHPEDRESTQAVIQNAISNCSAFQNQERILRPDGSIRILESFGKVETNREGHPVRVIGACVDVTDRIRMEKHLSKSQKMEALGQLAGAVAHDFNNLLTVINGHAAMLTETDTDSAFHREALRDILEAGQRATSLTTQLLAFSRGDGAESSVIDLNKAVRESLKLVRRLVGGNITMLTELDCREALVQIDQNQLDQLVMNLMINARDAMPNGGELLISSESDILVSEPKKENSGPPPGRYVSLQVKDTGHGISPEVLPNIFEPFFTTKESGQGTGLGLAVVHSVVEQWSGHIEVSSEHGQGTTFRIFFPRLDKQRPADTPKPSPNLDSSQATILVVDDEESIRRLVSKVLRREGYQVLEAADGREALELARDNDFELLLTDIVMPGISGRELSLSLKESRPDLLVLFMSGYTGSNVGLLDPNDQYTSFLRKPFAPDALKATLTEMLSRSKL